MQMGPQKGTQMTHEDQSIRRPQDAKEVCNLCGKPSANRICDTCADIVRAEALEKKKHEEKRA
jgi:ribosomal protein L37AE/L43A